jgi:hypothetical protein
MRFFAPAAVLLLAATPRIATSQVVVACDFDIADDIGRFVYGNTIHLDGRRGTSSNTGSFYLINGNSPETDVDHDGYATACDYNNLYIASRTNLLNTSNAALAIPGENIVVTNFPRSLLSGQRAEIQVAVEVPQGTAAGTYIGQIEVRDNVVFAAFSPTRETLNVDVIQVAVTVAEDMDFKILNADSAKILDSLVIRGRTGQRVSGVLRIANTGNANLADVRVTATDLRSESAVGIVIPASNITISPGSIAGLQFGDTTRITVSVQIPRGILGGRYRGSLVVQGQGTAPQQIPLIVIVTSTRGILFSNNPVREINGDIANIAFNGDPNTTWRLSIYDMAGLVTYKTSGTVFAGAALPGGTALVGADFAVNVIWPLRNNRGEGVASGMYLVVVESIVNGQRQLAQDKLMVIR